MPIRTLVTIIEMKIRVTLHISFIGYACVYLYILAIVVFSLLPIFILYIAAECLH